MAEEEHLFRKKPVVVKAHRVEESVRVSTAHGDMTAYKGDWLVRQVDGNEYPVSDSTFRATHEPVVDTGAAVVPVPWPDEKRVLRIAHGFPCPACQAHLLLDIREDK